MASSEQLRAKTPRIIIRDLGVRSRRPRDISDEKDSEPYSSERDNNRKRSKRHKNPSRRDRKYDSDSDPSSSSSDSSDTDDSRYRYRRHRKDHDSRRSRTYKDRSSSRETIKKLRPEDVMLYDPKTTSVTVFIKRIKQVRTLYGRKAVLKVLPLCLRGKALDWYTHLSESTTEDMQHSIKLWAKYLDRRFKQNPLDARKEADRLCNAP
jgi:hypothetical protein